MSAGRGQGTRSMLDLGRWFTALALSAAALGAGAQTCTNQSGGGWEVAATWSCTVAPTQRVPTATDHVVIQGSNTVSVTTGGEAAASITINGGNQTTTLTIGSTGSLTVTNDIVINGPVGNNNNKTVEVSGGSLTVTNGNLIITGGTGNPSASQLKVNSGTASIGGNATITAGTANNADGVIAVGSGTLTVSGNVTVNGGTVSGTRDGLLKVDTGLITINGGLSTVSTVATAATVQITAAAGRITVAGAAGVNNGDVVAVGLGTFSVTHPAATFTNSNAGIVGTVTVSNGTLNIAGNFTNAAGETVSVAGTGNITVGGTLTNNGTLTYAAGGTLNLAGNAVIDGTFNRGTSTVICDGTSAQNLSGTTLSSQSTGFQKLTINNAAGVTFGNDVYVATVLTLTSGALATGAYTLTVVSNAPTAVVRTGGFVAGKLRRAFPTAGSSTRTFDVGSATYAPVTLTLANATAGSLTVSTTSGDHPNIATSVINPGLSVNRYWTLADVTVGFTSYAAVFGFSAGDLDSGASTGSFEAQRYAAGAWTDTTTGTRTATSIQITGLTAMGEFAVGNEGGTIAQIHYIYTDHLNTPRAITNEAATTIWKWDNTDPFGNNAANEDPDNNSQLFVFNLRFPGQYFDKETNLHYNYKRDYDPSIGRYVQSDPIGLSGGINTYGYANQNPLSYIDPLGEQVGQGIVFGVGTTVVVGGAIYMSGPAGRKAIKSIAQKIADLCTPSGKDPCDEQQEDEEQDCWRDYGSVFGPSHFSYRGCMERARIRADLCRRNLPQPPKWSDSDVTGQPRRPPLPPKANK